ncbi:MAG: protein kinase [Polyangiaceae bacterium]
MTDTPEPPTTGSRATEPLAEHDSGRDVTAPTLQGARTRGETRHTERVIRLGGVSFDQRYEPKDVLGRGGMGEVQLCLDRRVGREVAMKVVRVEAAHRDDLMMRFEREAKIQGRLEHPSVVPVHDLGLRPDGSVYFTMKRVRGMTLEAIIDGLRAKTPGIVEQFNTRRVLGALSDLCLGVAFAHSRGVIHRDLKPSNVILGEFGEVHLLDWGIAKVLDADSDISAASVRALAPLPETPMPSTDSLETLVGQVPETRAGSAMGTPGYMSPEQMRGETVDARSDIYALGCLIFEALTFQPLHPRESMDTLRRCTLNGTSDPRPSARCPERRFTPELDEICSRATALRPDLRYASARELHDALERFLAGDRDDERRRAMARERIESARSTLERGSSDGELSGRVRALRELTAAISLDPDNPEALRLLARALTDAPDVLPAEAEAALDRQRSEQRRASARISALGLSIVLVLLPAFASLGVRDWGALAFLYCCVAAFAAFSYWLSRSGENGARHVLASAVLGSLVAASASVVTGPMVLVPTAACVVALAVIVNSRAGRRRRNWVLAVTALSMLVPLGLQLSGALPSSYAFDADGMRILPRAVELPEFRTLTMLALGNLACLLVPVFAVGRALDVLSGAERRLFAQAWQLQQLLPERSSLPPPSRSN